MYYQLVGYIPEDSYAGMARKNAWQRKVRLRLHPLLSTAFDFAILVEILPQNLCLSVVVETQTFQQFGYVLPGDFSAFG